MADPRPGLTLIVGPLGSAEVSRRCRDRDATARIEAAIAALAPACRPCRFRYEVEAGDRGTRPGRAAYAVLGRTTYLRAGTKRAAPAATAVY